jgi:hypothetical protein
MGGKERMTLAAAGLVFAAGTTLLGGQAGATARPGAASVSRDAANGETATGTTDSRLRRPRCRRYVRGHYVRRRVRGRIRRVWIAGHWIPRGCRHR